ncbi:MAG: hypothetical protein ABIH11_08965, partial [Candidatus Altiarchaeota archaeon]
RHIERFKDKHQDQEPYVKDDRWVVDTARRYTDANVLLDELVKARRGFGKTLRELEDVEVVAGQDVLNIKSDGWLKYLNEYME